LGKKNKTVERGVCIFGGGGKYEGGKYLPRWRLPEIEAHLSGYEVNPRDFGETVKKIKEEV